MYPSWRWVYVAVTCVTLFHGDWWRKMCFLLSMERCRLVMESLKSCLPQEILIWVVMTLTSVLWITLLVTFKN